MGELASFAFERIAAAVLDFYGYTRDAFKSAHFWLAGLMIVCCLLAVALFAPR